MIKRQTHIIAVAIITVFALVACSTAEERAAYARQQAAKEVAAHKPYCLAYGYKEGTDQLASCIAQRVRDQARREERYQASIVEANNSRQLQKTLAKNPNVYVIGH